MESKIPKLLNFIVTEGADEYRCAMFQVPSVGETFSINDLDTGRDRLVRVLCVDTEKLFMSVEATGVRGKELKDEPSDSKKGSG